jgi:hypothetical protein
VRSDISRFRTTSFIVLEVLPMTTMRIVAVGSILFLAQSVKMSVASKLGEWVIIGIIIAKVARGNPHNA